MLETMPYTREDLLRERREAAVRSLIRAVGYALSQGWIAEHVGHFLFDSYRQSGQFRRWQISAGEPNTAAAFVDWHMFSRWHWCDEVGVKPDQSGLLVESASMLDGQEQILSFHGVTRLDMEACLETFWREAGQELGLQVTYTIGTDRDWVVVRPSGGATVSLEQLSRSELTIDQLAEHRRVGVATGIACSVGFAKHQGEEPEHLGRFFYEVWEKSGHYNRMRQDWGYGNVLAYAKSIVRSRQILYTATDMMEDLDGYTISSPSWATEMPQMMGTFGVLPDDVYRYYEGGGVAACALLGLQYTDRSTDRLHRIWVRSR